MASATRGRGVSGSPDRRSLVGVLRMLVSATSPIRVGVVMRWVQMARVKMMVNVMERWVLTDKPRVDTG